MIDKKTKSKGSKILKEKPEQLMLESKEVFKKLLEMQRDKFVIVDVKKLMEMEIKGASLKDFNNQNESSIDNWFFKNFGLGRLFDEVELKDINDLKDILLEQSAKMDVLSARIEELEKSNNNLNKYLYNNLIERDLVEKYQYIPIEIYIDSDSLETALKIYEAVNLFLNEIGFQKEIELQAIKGSWFKRFVAKSKEAISSDEVLDRLKEAEYGLEVNMVLKKQSEIDVNSSQALLNIVKSIESVPNAVIRIGSILVVKLTNELGEVSLQSRTLSIKEMYLLNKNPDLLQKPQKILSAIAKAVDEGEKN